MLIHAGIVLVKYWFSVSDDEQERRFRSRIEDPEKRWKLEPDGPRGWARGPTTRAKDEMFRYTDTKLSPWWVVDADDKRRARLCISHLLADPVRGRHLEAVDAAAAVPTTTCARRSTSRPSYPTCSDLLGDQSASLRARGELHLHVLMPPMKFERRISAAATVRMSGMRSSTSRKISCSSMREVGAEAEVVPARRTPPAHRRHADVETERVVEHRLVAVGEDVPHHDLVAFGDLTAVELGRARRGATEVVHGDAHSEDLDRRPDPPVEVVTERGVLVGMPHERPHAPCGGVACGLVARHRAAT